MPTYVPWCKVWLGTDLVFQGEMPLIDKNSQVGLFCLNLFLGDAFSVGHGTVEMHYRVSTKFGLEVRTFEIIPGGRPDGQMIGSHWYARPQAEFVVSQTESGTIRKGKNPRVT